MVVVVGGGGGGSGEAQHGRGRRQLTDYWYRKDSEGRGGISGLDWTESD